MTTSTTGELQGRPPWAIPARRAFVVLALPLLAALGYFIVWTVTVPAAPKFEASPVPIERTKATQSPKRFAAITGLEVLWVAESGDGGILDLRYRVVDEKKASGHKSHQSVPAIIDLESGEALTTQWMGHAHPVDSFQPDRNYWMLFLNPRELVERGDLVAIRLGHARLTGVRVR